MSAAVTLSASRCPKVSTATCTLEPFAPLAAVVTGVRAALARGLHGAPVQDHRRGVCRLARVMLYESTTFSRTSLSHRHDVITFEVTGTNDNNHIFHFYCFNFMLLLYPKEAAYEKLY